MQDAVDLLCQLWGVKPRGRGWVVPLPTPSSLMRSDLASLRRREYLVAVKHDGVRAVLVLGWSKSSGRYAALVHRHGRARRVGVWSGDPMAYAGTALDGELLHGDGGAEGFRVFDAVAVNGRAVGSLPLSQRLEHARRAVASLESGGRGALAVEVKSFVPSSEAGPLLERALSGASGAPPEKSDGVVLAPENESVGVGRQVNYFKVKPVSEITVDLAWDPGEGLLRCGPPGRELIEDVMPRAVWSEERFSRLFPVRGVVECTISQSGALEPKLLREDKATANSKFVVQRTVANVEENIQAEEVIRALCARE